MEIELMDSEITNVLSDLEAKVGRKVRLAITLDGAGEGLRLQLAFANDHDHFDLLFYDCNAGACNGLPGLLRNFRHHLGIYLSAAEVMKKAMKGE